MFDSVCEEQIQQIEAVIYDSGTVMIDLRAKLDKNMLELDRLLRATNLDDEAVQSTIDALADAKCAVERVQLTTRYKVAKVLNTKQRELMRRFLEQVKRERDQRRERFDRDERMRRRPRR